ncbi:MAG: PQQ-binding-like beta-propeller repeat protein [Tannerellaceae bacterium]|nr:PQQ-binding-like beta-propeller repeat protein [Tannerellaceae bacterium]
MSSPLIYQEAVYVASVDENLRGQAFVYCLDGYTGSLRWKYPVRNSVKNTIVAGSGLIFAQDAAGYLYAIDAVTGLLHWEKKLAVDHLPALVEGLVTANGIVYAGTGKGLGTFQCQTSEPLWNNTEWSQAEGTTSTLAIGNDILLSGAQWRGLYANNLHTGKLLWTQATGGLSNRGASAAIYDGLIYLISGKSFFILHAENGQIIVRKELPCSVDVTSTHSLQVRKLFSVRLHKGLWHSTGKHSKWHGYRLRVLH